MAEGLAEAGATVVLNGRDPATLAARERELLERGLSAAVTPFDVADEAAARAGVDAVVRAHGRLDILVANAGTHHARPLVEWEMADWRRVMALNLDACFVLAQEAARAMMPRRQGRIIFTASLTGLMGRATIHAYAASKAGLAGLTRSLAAELGPHAHHLQRDRARLLRDRHEREDAERPGGRRADREAHAARPLGQAARSRRRRRVPRFARG